MPIEIKYGKPAVQVVEGRSPKVRADHYGAMVFSEVFQGFGVECDDGTLYICQRDGTLEINVHRGHRDKWFRVDFETGLIVPELSAEQILRQRAAEDLENREGGGNG